MPDIFAPSQCGNFLVTLLQKQILPEKAKPIAAAIGYNDSPLFGARKKRAALLNELLLIHTALTIFAVNAVFNKNTAKAVIDSFLEHAKTNVFSHVEREIPNFARIYTSRMEQYFPIFHQDKAPIGLSFALMQNLGLKPLNNLNGQIILAKHLGMMSEVLIEALKKITIIGVPAPPTKSTQASKERTTIAMTEFMAETSIWAEDDKMKAMTVVAAALEGNIEMVRPILAGLNTSQVAIVERFLAVLDE